MVALLPCIRLLQGILILELISIALYRHLQTTAHLSSLQGSDAGCHRVLYTYTAIYDIAGTCGLMLAGAGMSYICGPAIQPSSGYLNHV
jgi:hypothetical protein